MDRLRFCVVMAWAAFACLPSIIALPLRIEVSSQSLGVTRFTAMGAEGPNVNLQGSFDLERWFVIGSAPVVSGRAELAHTNSEPVDAWFYRAVAEPAAVQINVGAQVDTNRAVGGVITPESGGELELLDASGVQYRFTVQSNIVAEPMLVRMTVITNFTSLPLENRFRAAVVFEPSGFEFGTPAELTIRFPQSIPMLEMVAYGFEGTGENLHLQVWDPATNQVTLPIFHFSGAGVAAQSFAPEGDGALSYEQVRTSTRDAERAADQVAGEALRDASRAHRDGKITREKFQEAVKATRWVRNIEVYALGIKPLLGAAARNCSIGELIMEKLEQLEANSELPYGQNRYYRKMVELAPALRCQCAREWLTQCENNPNSSGVSATSALNRILLNIQTITGRADGAGCDLGTDDEIFARLAKAACHKPWEGTVRYSRIATEQWTTENPAAPSAGGLTHNSREEISYSGRLARVIKEDGGETGNGGDWQSWTFLVSGNFAASLKESSINRVVDSNWTATDINVESGAANPQAFGQLYLRFDNGKFSNMSPSAGLDDVKYVMPLRRSTERQIDCRKPACPAPLPLETVNSGNRGLSFASVLDKTNPSVEVKPSRYGNGFIVSLNRIRIEPNPILNGTNIVEEHISVQLWKGTR